MTIFNPNLSLIHGLGALIHSEKSIKRETYEVKYNSNHNNHNQKVFSY